MKKVLVTGASGFIGRYTIQLLNERGYEVHAFSRQNSLQMNCNWHHVNIFDSESTNRLLNTIRPTYLLHLAWDVSPGIYWNSRENYRWATRSFELIVDFHKYGGQRAVIAGTCAEYDWNYGYLSETGTPLVYNNPYAACKNSFHHLLESYSKAVDMSYAWGRIFWLYGPHENTLRLVPSIINSLLSNRKFICKGGYSTKDFLHVRDVADAFVTLLDNKEINGSVNIASGKGIEINYIASYIANQLGREELIEYSPDKSEFSFVVGDISRLRDDALWAPKISLEKGLVETINWWKEK